MINHIIYFFSPRVKKNAEIIAIHNISAAVLKGLYIYKKWSGQ